MTFCRYLPALLLVPAGLLAADWPQWRGPARDGTLPAGSLPERLPERLTPAWKQPLGGGYGGIAVAGGRVYVMDRQKGPREVERVLCLDATSGKQLWTHTYSVAYGKMDYGNGPRSTPTVHDGRVYTFGAVGHLHCLDAGTGKVLWAHDCVEAFKARVPTWGHACSPLVDGERLLVQVGAPGACLMAFDCTTGKVLWKALDDPPGYASPTILETATFRRLVYFTPKNVVGLDPATGRVCWAVPFPGITYGVSIGDIVWDGRVVLASNYWSGSKAFQLDRGGDNPELVWEGKALSLLMSTPLVRDGKVYAIDRFRSLKCLELATGKVLWEGEAVTERGNNPHASLIGAGSRVLLFNDRGELVLGDLEPTGFTTRGTAKILPGRPWAHHAFAAGRVFARSDEEIVCVEVEGR